MQKYFFTLFFLAIYCMAISQGVGVGTNTPNPNAVLEIKQTANKGFLMPRGNSATRTALNSNTAKGLMLYDTTTNSLWIHNGNGMASGWTNQQVISSSTIIPYASGGSVEMTTDFSGQPSTGALVSFGSSYSGISVSGPTIVMDGSGNTNHAFSVPRNGTVISVAASFTNTLPFILPGAIVFITAQLYIAPVWDNTFSPLGASVTIPLSAFIPVGFVAQGISSGLFIPVTAESRLLMVFSASVSPAFESNLFLGYDSAGVTIE